MELEAGSGKQERGGSRAAMRSGKRGNEEAESRRRLKLL